MNFESKKLAADRGILRIVEEKFTGINNLIAIVSFERHQLTDALVKLRLSLSKIDLNRDNQIEIENDLIDRFEVFGVVVNGCLDRATAKYLVQHTEFYTLFDRNKLVWDDEMIGLYQEREKTILALLDNWKKQGISYRSLVLAEN